MAESSFFSVAIGSVANRLLVTRNFLDNGLNPISIISNYSRIGFETTLGDGAIICPNVTIMPKVQVGLFFHAHLNSYVAHNGIIGNYVTLLPGALVSGYVKIEDNVLVGAGATIKNGSPDNYITIGRNSVIGMGAVVTEDVPSGKVVAGNPARIIRDCKID